MTQEEKQLLLIDLCARLLYGVFLKIGEHSDYILQGIVLSNINKPLLVRCNGSNFECSIEVVKPYLRSIHKLTKEELEELEFLTDGDYVDYCNKHHIDYHNLIPKGLALEAKEGMYNIKEK